MRDLTPRLFFFVVVAKLAGVTWKITYLNLTFPSWSQTVTCLFRYFLLEIWAHLLRARLGRQKRKTNTRSWLCINGSRFADFWNRLQSLSSTKSWTWTGRRANILRRYMHCLIIFMRALEQHRSRSPLSGSCRASNILWSGPYQLEQQS